MRFLLLAALVFFAVDAWAGKISRIEIDGAKRTDEALIKTIITIKPGDTVSDEIIARNLQSLWNSRFFSYINMKEDKGVLRIVVMENPIIAEVSLSGNTEVREDDIVKRMATQPRSVFSEDNIRRDIESLKATYKQLGFFRAVISARTFERSDNRVDVVFDIEEGEKAYVRSITFTGNTMFSSARLREVIMTREFRWWRVFESMDTFHEERVLYDTELLRNFYFDNGFLDASINSFDARLSDDGTSFFINFDITEGSRFRVAEILIESTIPEIDTEALRDEVLVRTGRFYDHPLARRSSVNMTRRLGGMGYPFANVNVQQRPDRDTSEVVVIFTISDSVKSFIDKINISGNARTHDAFIRRNLMFDEASAFNSTLLAGSEQRLMGTGFFSGVRAVPVRSTEYRDKVDINVVVEEKPTGEMTFSAGWSTYERGLLEFGIRENNFRGKGQVLGFSAMYNSLQNNYNVSFSEPYLFDLDLMGGVDVFYSQNKFRRSYGYDIDSYGIAPRLSWTYNDNLSQRVRFTWRHDQPTNINENLSQVMQDNLESRQTYRLGQTLIYRDQTIDFVNNTRSGHTLSYGTDYAGFGGAKNFIRHDASARQFFSFFDQNVQLGLLAEAGSIEALGGTRLSTSDRYRLGGDSLRGFDYFGIGARPEQPHLWHYSFGGNWKVNGTAQLNFPIGFPKAAKISGYVFYDWGTLGRPDVPDMSNVLWSDLIRTSYGWGIAWESPLGHMNFSWGYPITYEPYDRRSRFLFSIGSRF
ncbi:MAG: outer membrane protein assembly factor BamA [Alphaproteobacteria bacterium]|nr:outer membrane protein assembly factor BamA [Alphaproteobacteria bacterium]